MSSEEDKIVANTYKRLFLIVFSIIIIFCAVLVVQRLNSSNEEEKEPVAWCGTATMGSRLDSLSRVRASISKELFKRKCAQCHNRNMRDNLTGPALQGSFHRWNRDTLALLNYLNDSETYLSTTTNEYILNVHEEFGRVRAHENMLSERDLLDLILYMNK